MQSLCKGLGGYSVLQLVSRTAAFPVLDHSREAGAVEEFNALSVRLEQILFLKLAEKPADRLDSQAEIVSDFASRHAQLELRSRKPALLEAHGNAEEEGRKPLIRVEPAQKREHLVFVSDLLAEQTVYMMLE